MKILVIGDMLELGDLEEDHHKTLGKYLSEKIMIFKQELSPINTNIYQEQQEQQEQQLPQLSKTELPLHAPLQSTTALPPHSPVQSSFAQLPSS